MKAIAKTRRGPGVEIVDMPVPEPGPGELLVRVGACGICGSDLHLYEWELGAERMVRNLPLVLGHEPAGDVTAVGDGVKGFKSGDRVALDPFGHCGKCDACLAGRFHLCGSPTHLGGAFAEYAIAPMRNAYVVPSDMDIETAALLEPFGTGLHALEQSSLKCGDSAVIEGPGPIGISVALAARALGVTSIVVTGLRVDAARLELVRKLGFKTVCAEDHDWIAKVRSQLPSDGADVVFDACGEMQQVRDLVRRGGQLVNVGWPARDLSSAELRGLFFHGVNLINSRVRTPETWRRAIAMVASGDVDLKPMITHRLGLGRGIEAFELLRRKEGTKVLIKPNA